VISFVLGDDVPHAHVWLLPVPAGLTSSELVKISAPNKYTEVELDEVVIKIVNNI
jgi:hypothetical protein